MAGGGDMTPVSARLRVWARGARNKRVKYHPAGTQSQSTREGKRTLTRQTAAITSEAARSARSVRSRSERVAALKAEIQKDERRHSPVCLGIAAPLAALGVLG